VTKDPSNGSVRLTDRLSIGVLTRIFPRDLVDEIVNEAGRREKRSRLLPAHVVVYFVLGLGLFFGESYDEVMRRLVGGLQFMRNWPSSWAVPTSSAMSQARQRLGEEPLRELFRRVARPIAGPGDVNAWFAGRRVMAIDGVVLDAPDTPANEEEFGYTTGGRGSSVFPHVRIVGLGECATHALVGAVIGRSSQGERTLAYDLVTDLEPDMLVLADRGFYSFRLWTAVLETGADLLFRVSTKNVLPVIEVLADGSYTSVLVQADNQSAIRKGAARREKREAGASNKWLLQNGKLCRVIEYTIEGSEDKEVYRLVTSILDPEDAPSSELAALYSERWEFELTLDEIEIHQLGHGRVLRSKSPEMVKQEVWGILLTHYAIRHLIHEAADYAAVDDDRISFLRALRVVRRQMTGRTNFSPSPDSQR